MFDFFDLGDLFQSLSNCKWYRLQNDSLKAAVKMIEVQESDRRISREENIRLREILGLDYAVMRIIPGKGPVEAYPEVFTLHNGSATYFYMKCPIGGDIEGTAHFEPRDASLLTPEEISEVTSVLFAPGTQTTPSILRETSVLIHDPMA